MQLVLAILSALVLWLLLGVLVVMLGRIRAALARIHLSLAKIAMGVRAIESETAILKDELPITVATLGRLADGAEDFASRLVSAESHLAETDVRSR